MTAPTTPDRTEPGTDEHGSPDRPERRVVVGIDGSAVAAHALDQARAEARLMDAHLDVVWAWTRDDVPRPFRSTARTWATSHASVWAAPGTDGPRSMTVRALWGAPGPTIVDGAEGADLVVVGARARTGGLDLHLGSTSRYVVDHAEMPVMVVRGGEGPSPVDLGGPIVVGIDGSDPSRRALEWALHEAARRQVGVVAVHGWEVPGAMAGPVPTTLRAANLLAGGAERFAHDELERMVAVVPTVPRTAMAVGRSGAAAVLDVAETTAARLVVVGCRGRGSVVHRVLGSVSHHVVAVSSLPVVTVR